MDRQIQPGQMEGGHTEKPGIARRALLQGAGAGALLSLLPEAALARRTPRTAARKRRVLVVSDRVVLRRDLDVPGVVVERGGELIFDPRRSVTLRSRGNVVVRGRLVMKPARARVHHSLVFAGIDESRVTGAHHETHHAVLPHDVGLWVVGRGALELAGTPKRAWLRAAGPIEEGATRITLDAEPTGWRVGDELVVTPTGRPGTVDHVAAFDVVRVRAVEGNEVELSGPLRHAHPAVEVSPGLRLGAEVLNLTRNVRIRGSRRGRAHVLIHSSRRQKVEYTEFRFVGPSGKLGRYGLHFHFCGWGSNRSIVRGSVIRDSGNHAFVTHGSHGVSYKNCISHDTIGSPYWWDPRTDTRDQQVATNRLTYRRCVASLVRTPARQGGFRLAAFALGLGQGNRAVQCVATGVMGRGDSSGFMWPEGTGRGVWAFRDCVAHNNARHGIFTWQNTKKRHFVTDFIGYHNGAFGVSHGAYRNVYVYEGGALYGNGSGGVELHSHSLDSREQIFRGLRIDCAGVSEFGVVTARHVLGPGSPTRFVDCRLAGHTKAGFGLIYEGENGPSTPERIDVIRCRFDGNEFWLEDRIHPRSVVRYQPVGGEPLAIRRIDQPGMPRLEWNASVEIIPPFVPRQAAHRG